MIKNIIFDFDGVILDSVPVKTEAFKQLFKDFPKSKVNELIEYHLLNGGKSRYIKITYFFDELLGQSIEEKEILKYATKYSELTREELSNPKYLISETISFIKKKYKKLNLHVASGADEKDLRYICDKLDLSKYFISINGSPTVKNIIVKNILSSNDYDLKEIILIGDSINDFEAAKINEIDFFAFNNNLLKEEHKYIENFSEFL